MEALFDSLLADDRTTPDRVVIQPLYGGSQKAVRDMSEADFSTASNAIMAKVREQAFSRGLPIVYELDGRTVREYADGRIEPIS